jgi:phytoene dehydrogenase-like protein
MIPSSYLIKNLDGNLKKTKECYYSTMDFDLIVIGAGSGGIFTAALAQKAGLKTLLLEAHSSPGGCASFFSNNGMLADVGATTISGLQSKRPLAKILQNLNLELSSLPYTQGIQCHLSQGLILKRGHHLHQWIDHLNSVLPHLNHTEIWQDIHKTSHLSWDFLNNFDQHPLSQVRRLVNLSSIKALPSFFKSVDSQLASYIQDPQMRQFINGQLLISTQTSAEKVPYAIGAMALSYPEEIVCLKGGMFGLWNPILNQFKKHGGTVLFKHKVHSIKKYNDDFIVSTALGSSFSTKKVVSNLTVWDHANLLDLPHKKNKTEFAWGAFCIYLKVKFKTPINELYHQVFLQDGQSYFISFSHPLDTLRMQDGFQSTTISIHVHPEEWFHLSEHEYEQKKAHYVKMILDSFKIKFKAELLDYKDVVSATPKTFYDYTHRLYGKVGGIPINGIFHSLLMARSQTPIKNYFLIGDTIFPGQSLASQAQAALFLQPLLLK